jgi:glycosyltransferase involved in cell wall biosynthesis
MHIALWSPAWPLERYQNGIVTYVHWMKREFEERGHRVSVLTDERYASADADVGYARVRMRDKIRRRLTSRLYPSRDPAFDYARVIAAAIADLHRRDPIDVIEMEETFGWFEEIRRRTAIPLLVKLHGPAFLRIPAEELDTSLARERIEREGDALRRAAAIVAPSSSTLLQTLERYHLAPRLQGVIVNPLSMGADWPEWKLEACDRNTLLFVGRFDLAKGADILLQAFSILLQDLPDLRLIFVGPDDGLRRSGGERVGFASFCEQLFTPAQRARIDYRGRMPNQEIAKLRAQAMVTIVPSRWENQAYTLLEAMLQGCPVVSSDAGGCPESVTAGVSGLLAKSEDPADLASQIRSVLRDPSGAAAMGRAARLHVLEHHSAAKVADGALEMYQRVIAAERG